MINFPADALPPSPSVVDPYLEEVQDPTELPAAGLEDLGLVGPSEGYKPFDPRPATLPAQGDPGDEDDYDEGDDGDQGPEAADEDTPSRRHPAPARALPMAPAAVLSCRDLEARGLWDTEDCCHEMCHAHDDLRPAPARFGPLAVAGCCQAHAALARRRPDGFVAALFGGQGA